MFRPEAYRFHSFPVYAQLKVSRAERYKVMTAPHQPQNSTKFLVYKCVNPAGPPLPITAEVVRELWQFSALQRLLLALKIVTTEYHYIDGVKEESDIR